MPKKKKKIKQAKIKKTRLIIEVGILVFLIILVGHWAYKKGMEKKDVVTETQCELLNANCNSISCKYYYMCNTTDFQTCAIYDCDSYIKAVIKDNQGNIITKENPKVNRTEVFENIQNCRGEAEIISRKCVDGKGEYKVRVETKGECPVNSFIVNQGGWDYTPQFEKRDDYFYLTLRDCGKIIKLTAIGRGGIIIEK